MADDYAFEMAASAVRFGAGVTREVGADLAELGARRVLVLTDSTMATLAPVRTVLESLEAHRVGATLFDRVRVEPTDVSLQEAIAFGNQESYDAFVAVGGGSTIDTAKAVNLYTCCPPADFLDYVNPPIGKGLPVPGPLKPLFAIPTTAGTGSEATCVAVITDTAREEKMMLLSQHLMANTALVDFELSMTMPQALTAHVGVDTLTHGIEAYVSRKAGLMTDPIALSCIALAAGSLLTAWREPGNRAAREAMAMAACQGGMAFSNSSVCLVHGMSRPLGALYHLPHGLSNAVLLPAVTRFSLAGAPARYATIARIMGLAGSNEDDATAGRKLADGLEALNEALVIPPLRECVKVGRAKFERSLEKMAGDALASGSPQNNPVMPSAEQIMALYRDAW